MIVRHRQRAIARVVLFTFGASLAACGGGGEQPPATTSTMAPPTTLAPPTTTPPPTLPAQAPEQLSKQQLRELVAPVALYPDVVLASLLPATTFPEQIQDAAGWVAQNPGQVQAVPEDRDWDGSVAGLLQFPDVLTWLDDNDPWTEQMGEAVTYQQGDVLQAVQDYRQEVMAAGNLESNQYQKVTKDADQDIRIEPAQPDTVYVPTYDAAAATQPQEKTGINPWLAFGGGVAVGALGAWALYSIFDDDDDDDDDHHHHHRRRRINAYDNVIYRDRARPRPVVWQPRTRTSRVNVRQVAKPKPLEQEFSSKAAGGQAGVRPPQVRRGKQRPGQAARPATATATTPPALGAQQQPRKGKQAGGGGGGGGKKGKREQQAKPAPVSREGMGTAAPAEQGGQKAGKKKNKKKKGGGN